MRGFDVAIVGGGLAGLVCTRQLARAGASVVLIDQKRSVTEAVHTTGIFVRRTFEDFAFPPGCLGPVIRDVTLYSPGRRALSLRSERDEFRIGRMARLYRMLLEQACAAGATWLGARKVTGVDGDAVRTEGGPVRARFVVGADGVGSTVARALGLDVNREWIVGVEDVFDGAPLVGPPALHCFIDPVLAPGYLAWVAHDGCEVHVGVGGYPDRFVPARALARFRASIGDIVELSGARRVERRGGRIPVGGLLGRIACRRGLLVGDASGAVSPLTAGGLDPCVRQAHFAARVIARYLATGDAAALAPYGDGRLRAKFRARRAMRRAFAMTRSVPLAEAACAMLRVPGLRAVARHVFFGRGSFPDPQIGPTARRAIAPAGHWLD